MRVLEHQVLLFILLIHVAYCIQPSWLPNLRFLQVNDAVYAVNNLRVFKSHNIDVIAIKLKELVHRALNHRTLLNDSISLELNRHVNIDNYKVLMMEEVVGSNINDYYIARDALFQFNIINKLPWAKVHISNDLRKYFQTIESSHNNYNYVATTKLNLFTLVKCYGLLWSLNPCRIVHNAVIYDQNYHGHRISQLGFATLKGHLIDGDEMFRVMYNYQTSKVIFQLYSITKGSGPLGCISMPFIRPIQRHFFTSQIKCLKGIIADSRR